MEHFLYIPHYWSSDEVKDSNGNLVFNVKWPTFSKTSIVVMDASGQVLFKMHQKAAWFYKSKWEIHKVAYEPGYEHPLVYNVKSKSRPQNKLEVFMGPVSDTNPSTSSPEYLMEMKRGTVNIFQKDLRIAQVEENMSCCYEISAMTDIDKGLMLCLFLIPYAITKNNRAAAAGVVGAF